MIAQYHICEWSQIEPGKQSLIKYCSSSMTPLSYPRTTNPLDSFVSKMMRLLTAFSIVLFSTERASFK